MLSVLAAYIDALQAFGTLPWVEATFAPAAIVLALGLAADRYARL